MLNHIDIQGRMVRDPEPRRTASGNAVTSFTVAVERDIADKSNGKKEVDFIDCVAWRGIADTVSKYFSSGQMIVVSGKLQIRSWNDKNGNSRKSAEILVGSVYFCGSKGPSKPDPDQTYSGNTSSPTPISDFPILDDYDAQLPY